MSANTATGKTVESIHADAAEIMATMDRLRERFEEPGNGIKESEAAQSIDCLRSELIRLSSELEGIQSDTSGLNAGGPRRGSNLPAPYLLGGLAVGVFLEKRSGSGFSIF